MNEAIPNRLRDIHAQAIKLCEELFPEVKQYKRDYRMTIITLMRYQIDLEKLEIERLKLR